MSATSVGEIGLDLVVNQNQFNKQMSGITSLAKKAGAALAGARADLCQNRQAPAFRPLSAGRVQRGGVRGRGQLDGGAGNLWS